MKKVFICLIVIFASNGCSVDSDLKKIEKDKAPSGIPLDVMAVPDAIPRYEKRTRAGNAPQYTVLGKQYRVLPDSYDYQVQGVASWYGKKFHGRKTANGEVYDMYAMTAAHKTLPIPSYVQVTNLNNQRSIIVRINDRGPFHKNRIIDLSYAAAVKLGIQQAGTGFVKVTAINDFDGENGQQTITKKPVDVVSMQVYLQVGAFSDEGNAKKLQKKLLSDGMKNIRVQLGEKLKKMIFKVQVGPLFSVHEADQASEKLALLDYMDIQLIVEKK